LEKYGKSIINVNFIDDYKVFVLFFSELFAFKKQIVKRF